MGTSIAIQCIATGLPTIHNPLNENVEAKVRQLFETRASAQESDRIPRYTGIPNKFHSIHLFETNLPLKRSNGRDFVSGNCLALIDVTRKGPGVVAIGRR
jgi:hypothetical protein